MNEFALSHVSSPDQSTPPPRAPFSPPLPPVTAEIRALVSAEFRILVVVVPSGMSTTEDVSAPIQTGRRTRRRGRGFSRERVPPPTASRATIAQACSCAPMRMFWLPTLRAGTHNHVSDAQVFAVPYPHQRPWADCNLCIGVIFFFNRRCS